MSPITNIITLLNCSTNSGKSIDAPTVIKNSPSNKPLKGSISTSNSCLNSLSAKTTPAKNVPKAGDKPIFCMMTAITMTKNKAKRVNNSRKRVSAIYRKSGVAMYLPENIIAAMVASDINTCAYTGRCSIKLP